jgi:outer membrane lipoprotein LolB
VRLTGVAASVAARSQLAALFAGLALAACATLPQPTQPQAGVATPDVPFTLSGRLSARHGENGVAGGFTWNHAPSHDAIDLSTPLGQTLARLSGEPGNVSVRLSDGRIETATTWAALTDRALGVTIPVEGLAWWIRGHAAPGSPSTIERDDRGRVSVLRQDGWEIVYAYANDAATMPQRVMLRYASAEPVDVRIAVDQPQ